MKTLSKKVTNYLGLVLAALIAASVFIPSITIAQEARAEFDEGRYRINIAGRQRMLTQRMAKAVCYVHEGHEVDMHLEMLEGDYHLFSDTLDILLNGGGEHNLAPETDRRTVEELGHVAKHWAPLSEIITRAVETGVVSDEDEEFVDTHDLELLEDSNHAVSLIEQNYANPNTLNMATAITLNIFGRQRMLAQRSAKDLCYVATGLHPDKQRADLDETQGRFSISLDAIQFGLPEMGIAPPPTEEIAAQLGIVAKIWHDMDEVFLAVINGAAPTDEQITFIAFESVLLQEEMNKAVQMYSSH